MQPDLKETLRQQLQDVHLPDQVGWWPLAMGWWLLIALAIVSISITLWYLTKQRKQNRYRRAALLELKHSYKKWQNDDNTGNYLQSANAILKRSVLHLADNTEAASQTGKNWLDTLNRHAQQALSADAQHALTYSCYEANPITEVHNLHTELSQWISSHRRTQIIMSAVQTDSDKNHSDKNHQEAQSA